MHKHNILVSGASGIVGYGILRSLRQAGMDLHLIGTSMHADSVAPAFCDVFESALPSNDAGYAGWLCNTIERHAISLIIPSIEIDMYGWLEHRRAIEERGAKALLNNPSLLSLCKDKWLFYKALEASGMPCAITTSLSNSFASLEQAFGLPFLLKPRQGFGAKGIVRIQDKDGFLRHQHLLGPVLMAQPIIGTDDEEYTASAFCDGRGDFHACQTLKRTLSKDGYTERAQAVSSEPFLQTIRALCALFLPVGPTNFQFRICRDGIKLLEINPRISSSTSIRTAFGYNESAMAVAYMLDGIDPVQPAARYGKAIRFIEDHIFYENSIHS